MDSREGHFLEARIVIVDDNPSNVRFIEMLLKMAGYTNVVCLTDSTKALDEIFQSGCDLALLDLQMPRIDGYEILKAIRAPSSPDPFIPVLIFTADDTRQARERALQAGASDFLTKPGDAPEILLRVRNFLMFRRMQLELQRDSEDLEKRVLARTVELLESNTELGRARDAALSAFTAKSRFLANMSHELRTPLSGIIGLTSILLTKDNDSDTRLTLNAIGTSGLALLRLLDDVLELADTETYLIAVNLTEVDLREVFVDAVTLYRAVASPRNISIDYTPPTSNIPNVLADPIRFGQILGHLLSNGVKFTEQGKITLTWKWKQHDDTVIVTFIVEDTGIGISPNKLESVFESFTQADDSPHRQYGGAGLGLTLTRRLVELMEGSISVTSVLGTGTRFEVEIPFRIVERQPSIVTSPQRTVASSTAQAVRVLLVEDNEVNLMVARELLEQCHCSVEIAVNGFEAIEKSSGQDFDLILMDIQMPLCDGLEATSEIRNRENAQGLKRTPIYALTANAMAKDRLACAQVGMQDLIPKPITLANIESLVATICS